MQTENILKSKKSLLGSDQQLKEEAQMLSKKEQEDFQLEEQQNTEFSVYFLISVFALTFIIIFAFHIFSQTPEVKFNQISFFRPIKFYFTNFYEEADTGSKIMIMQSKDEDLKYSYFSLTIGVGSSLDGEIFGLADILADSLVNHQYINYSQNSEIFLQTLKDNSGSIEYKVTDFSTSFFIKCHNRAFELVLDLFFVLITDVSYIIKTKSLKKYLFNRFGESGANIDQFESNLGESVITLLKVMHNPQAHVFQNGLKSKISENLTIQLKGQLKNFHQNYYAPSLMTLSVITNLSPQQILLQLRQNMKLFKNTQKQQRPFFFNSLQYMLQPSYMSKMHLIKSHLPENLLFFNFQVPYIIDENRSFVPMQLFEIFLNLDAENSFLKRLDHSDLTYDHKISIIEDDNSHCILQLRFNLRKNAINQIHKILILFFEFVNHLKKDNIEDHYSFLQNVSQYNAFFGLDSEIYKFQTAPLNNSEHVRFVSKKLQTQSPYHMFKSLMLGPYIKSSWSQFLSAFTIDNLAIVFLSPDIKTRNFRILEQGTDTQQYIDNNLIYDYNFRPSQKFQNQQKLQALKDQKNKNDQIQMHSENENDSKMILQQKKESQQNQIFQKQKKKFDEENTEIFQKLIDKYIAIRPITEYDGRQFFIYKLKPMFKQIFQKVIERSQQTFTNYLSFDQQQLSKYSIITSCNVPQMLSYGENKYQTLDKSKKILNKKKSNLEDNQNVKTIDTRKLLEVTNIQDNLLDQNTSQEFKTFVSFKKCLMREFALDTKTIIPTNLVKDNFLRVYFKQYRDTFQSKQVLNIELLSSSIYDHFKQKIETDTNNARLSATKPLGLFGIKYQKKPELLQAKVVSDLFCQYFVAYIFKNFVKEFVLGNSLDCEIYGTIVTLKMETFEQHGVIFSKKVLQELKNFNSKQKFDVATLNDLKYQYIAKLQKSPSETEPLTDYIFDKHIDRMRFNILYDENLKRIEEMVNEITVDDLIEIQSLIFSDLQVSLLYTGNVNAVNAVNESKHYLRYFFEENASQLTELVPRQVQLPLLLKSFGDRTQLYRICLGKKINKNVYKTIFMAGVLSNKQYIALNLTVDYLQLFFQKNFVKLKNVESVKVKIKDYYGQFGIMIHVEGQSLKPHMFEYIIENMLDQFIHFVQKMNNFDLKAKAETIYKRIIAISGTLKTVNNKILQLHRQSIISMSEMTFADSFKSFNKGFLVAFVKDLFYTNQKRMIFEFFKTKISKRIQGFRVDRNFMLNMKDFDINVQNYLSCFTTIAEAKQKKGQ